MFSSSWSQRGQCSGRGRPLFCKRSAVQQRFRIASHTKVLHFPGAHDFHTFSQNSTCAWRNKKDKSYQFRGFSGLGHLRGVILIFLLCIIVSEQLLLFDKLFLYIYRLLRSIRSMLLMFLVFHYQKQYARLSVLVADLVEKKLDQQYSLQQYLYHHIV